MFWHFCVSFTLTFYKKNKYLFYAKEKNHNVMFHTAHRPWGFFPPEVCMFNICPDNIVNEAFVVHIQSHPEWHL